MKQIELAILKELVFDICDFELTEIKLNSESEEYGACSFLLNKKNIEYRVSKITPKKIGQFVTIWKRNADGITEPFNISDNLDFIIILSKNEDNCGIFVFSKDVLAEKRIITKNNIDGKRGIRVYPPWDIAINTQAKKTQDWQIKYFFTINNKNNIEIEKLKKLLK